MQPIHLKYLSGPDVARLQLTDEEILGSVETALHAQGNAAVVIEPRVHLVPRDSADGHFNILRGVVHPSLTDIMDKVVVDDWGQCRKGLPYGALRAHVDLDKITAESLHAELGQIVAGRKPGRESDAETILFWHRGLSLSDIALGHAMLEKAAALGIGQTLRFA